MGRSDRTISAVLLFRQESKIVATVVRSTIRWRQNQVYTLNLAVEIDLEHPERYQPLIAKSVPHNYYYLQDGIGYTFDPVPTTFY
jgi:hypothetical protein